MATTQENLAIDQSKALVKITEMDHIVLRVKDVEEHVFLICEDVANRRDPESRLGKLNPILAKQLIKHIHYMRFILALYFSNIFMNLSIVIGITHLN